MFMVFDRLGVERVKEGIHHNSVIKCEEKRVKEGYRLWLKEIKIDLGLKDLKGM